MDVLVNGKIESVPLSACLTDTLRKRGNDVKTVVVELNGRIVPHEEFAQTCMQANDTLEIVHFVGGG